MLNKVANYEPYLYYSRMKKFYSLEEAALVIRMPLVGGYNTVSEFDIVVVQPTRSKGEVMGRCRFKQHLSVLPETITLS